MQVFDRWGKIVFSGERTTDLWNGIGPDGKESPQGTYAYRLIVNTRGGKEHVFNGIVNLIR